MGSKFMALPTRLATRRFNVMVDPAVLRVATGTFCRFEQIQLRLLGRLRQVVEQFFVTAGTFFVVHPFPFAVTRVAFPPEAGMFHRKVAAHK
jgi:hypothetical protein